MGTAFPLLNCVRTHCRRIENHFPFPAKNALACMILHIQSQNIPGGDTLGPAQKRPRCLDPDTNFRSACQRSSCSCFTKRPLRITCR